MRRLLLGLLCAALVWAPSSAAGVRKLDRGIVARVSPPRVVIRELDGSRLRFAVNRGTVITLDGRRVRLIRLRRGDVATVEHMGRVVMAIHAVRP